MREGLRFLGLAISIFALVDALAPKVKDGSAEKDVLSADVVKAGRKFLIASFPNLRQVAYTILPDNVWRPLVIGNVASPTSLAVDSQNLRLYVADPPSNVIWWFQLAVGNSGLLQTVGQPRAAVEGYSAHWLAVNGVGDLYFSGHRKPTDGQNSSMDDSVWRLDADQVASGDSFNPTEVYSKSNTGEPNSKVWQVSGLAVDSFYIYWGNQADGKVHGSVCKATRTNIGASSQEMYVKAINVALDEVRGITTTGTEIFWLAPEGVYGADKTSSTQVSDPQQGLIAPPSSANWSPMSIAWDGNSLLYLTDTATGAILTVPSLSSRAQNMTKFADAPSVQSLAVLQAVHNAGTGPSSGTRGLRGPTSASAMALLSLLAALTVFHNQLA